MARTETMVQLTDELIELLDDESRRRGTSRSALIREAIAEYLRTSGEAAITRAIVEGYKRVPQYVRDEWGDLSAQTGRATSDVSASLNEEERAAGHEPW